MKYEIKPNCLYLVTDSDLLSKSALSLESHVEQAILGGVDVVQLREKLADTGDFIEIGKRLLAVCQKHKIPLIINDRVDVALAIGADGVHVGQDDMPCAEVRRLIGDRIIGVSVNTVKEATQAVADGADYLGIGAIYDTATKALSKPTLGTSGAREVLDYLSTCGRRVGTVAIGGINASNIDRVMFASSVEQQKLDGIALVSAIMTSSEPKKAASGLKALMISNPPFAQEQVEVGISTSNFWLTFSSLVAKVRAESPLIQQMTNNVVKNFSANVTIAIGASPVMSEVKDEATDLARVNGAFLLNMGMVSQIETPIFAVQQNNRFGKPTVLDPVGAGGTTFRRAATKTYLDHCYFDVIKGNEGEIRATSGLASEQKGVDNVKTGTVATRCRLASELACKLKNVAVITGIEDVVSNGRRTAVIRCGHPLLGHITGSGCSLGSTIASFIAVGVEDKFAATISAVVFYGLCAEHAAAKETVKGPGTFVTAFIDSLYELSSRQDVLQDFFTRHEAFVELR